MNKNRSEIGDRQILINACRRGCKESLSSVCHKYKQAICDYLNGIGANGYAEDIAHTVFLRILSGQCKYDGTSDVKSYLFGVARKIHSDHVRIVSKDTYNTTAIEESRLPAEADTSPSATLEKFELHKLLAEGISKLPPKPRQAIQLVYFEGKTYQEAAQALGCNYNTVNLRIRYGLKRLSGIISDKHNSSPCMDLYHADKKYSKNANFL